jgi:hypothetical protein
MKRIRHDVFALHDTPVDKLTGADQADRGFWLATPHSLVATSRRLVSLWNMLRNYAFFFVAYKNFIAEFEKVLDDPAAHEAKTDGERDEERRSVLYGLKHTKKMCAELNLKVSLSHVKRLYQKCCDKLLV